MRRALIVSLAALPLLAGPAHACPNCRDAMKPDSGAQVGTEALGRGLSYSVLFMLAVPFGVFGTGAFLVYRASRKGLLPPL
jgi:hypothetical protein